MFKQEFHINYTSIIATLRKITDYISERIYGDCWFDMHLDSDGDFFVTFFIDLSDISYTFNSTKGTEEIVNIFSTNTEDIAIKLMYNQLTNEMEKKIFENIYRKDVDNPDPT